MRQYTPYGGMLLIIGWLSMILWDAGGYEGIYCDVDKQIDVVQYNLPL